jgi:hypothetical protein
VKPTETFVCDMSEYCIAKEVSNKRKRGDQRLEDATININRGLTWARGLRMDEEQSPESSAALKLTELLACDEIYLPTCSSPY